MAAEHITFPVLVGVAHWLVVQLAASLAYLYGTPTDDSAPYDYVPQPLDGLAHVLVEPMRMWDGFWYKLIADEGYGGLGIAKAAFWPLFPWLMRLGSRLTGAATETVGYVIANVSFVVALILLYRLISLDFDRATARRALWLLALFPTSFFFSAVYTESLFLMLAVGALLAARRRGWLLAGVLGALAALTRSQGVLLLLPFAVLLLQQHRFHPRRWFPDGLFAALPALGPLIFAWRLDRIQGDALAFVHVQAEWYRAAATPWETLRCAVAGCVLDLRLRGRVDPMPVEGADWGWIGNLLSSPTWGTLTSEEVRLRAANSDTLELVATLLFLALAVVGLRVLPLYQTAYLLPALAIPLFGPSIVHPLMSMPRFGLTLFPLFVVLALILNRPRVGLPVLAVSTLLLILLTAQFANWYWVS